MNNMSIINILLFSLILINNLNLIISLDKNEITQEQMDIYEKNLNFIFNTSYEFFDNFPEEKNKQIDSPNYNDVPEDDMKIFKQYIKKKYIDNNFKIYETINVNRSNRKIITQQLQQEPNLKLKKRETACGVRNSGGLLQNRLFNGTDVKIFEFPWVVAILEKTQNIDKPKFICSGSIIHPKVILSTASKFIQHIKDLDKGTLYNESINQLIVRAGEHDIKTFDELIENQERIIERIILHPNYKQYYSGYDLSIIIVNIDFDIFKSNVKPICLPSSEMNFYNELCYTVGWGKNNWGKSGKYQQILQVIDLPIINENDCIEKIKNESNNEILIKKLPSTTLCAGGQSDKKDACKGDSGSPLFCPIKNSTINQYYQVGIVSTGFDCSKSYPGFYTDITAVRTFIDSVIIRLDLENDSYVYKNDSIIDDDNDDDDDDDKDNVDSYNNDDINSEPVIETSDQSMRAGSIL